MKKNANELKKGDRIMIAGKKCTVEDIELSELGKHGTKKCRVEAKTEEGEKVVLIRPENYPFTTD